MPARPTWTDEVIATLRSRHAARDSFSQIADAIAVDHGMTFTRNACIGKAARLGLEARKEQGLRVPKPKVARLPRAVAPRVFKPKLVITPPPPPPPELPPGREGVPFLAWKPGQCRWPLWGMQTPFEAKEYCGEPVSPGSSYCPSCRHLSVAAPRAMKEAA